MKFTCDKCRTKYTIADEKVRGKVLKIRCKNCANVIEVRGGPRPGVSGATQRPPNTGALKAASRHPGSAARKRASAVAKPGPTPAKTPAAGQRSGLGARADQSRPGPGGSARRPSSLTPANKPQPRPAAPAAQQDFDDGDGKTTIGGLPDEFLAEIRSSHQRDRAKAAPPAPAEDDAPVWYLGDDRGEYGPMTFAELAARCQRGEPGPNAEAWKEGFDDWLPLEEITALKPYVKRAPPPRPQATSRPAPLSPYQKRPGLDPAAPAAGAAKKIPQAAKVTPAAEEVKEPLLKLPIPKPAEPKPAAVAAPPAPPAPEPSAPEPAASKLPRPASSLAALEQSLDTPSPDLATPVPMSSAHVSLGAAPSALESPLDEPRRSRRPALLIGGGAALLALVAIGLVIYLVSSRGKPKPEPTQTASADMASKPAPPMPARPAEPMAAMPAAMDTDDVELDLDIEVNVHGRNKRKRYKYDKKPDMRPAPTAPRPMKSDNLYGLSTMRPSFVGLMGFGSPSMRRSPLTAPGASRPGDLRSVVKRNYNRLKRCYEKAARLNTSIRNPKLRISIRVRASGKTRSVYVSPSRYQSDTLGICIRRSINAWRWPSFSSDYSYTFSARFHGG